MALENKHQKANRILQDIITETKKGSYLFTPESVYSILLKKELVEINSELKNDAGEVATRATEKGLELAKEEEKVMSEGNSGVSLATGFEIEDIPVTVAAGSRVGGRGSKYPFESLKVGQSFFVAPTEAMPEPWKSLLSTARAASKAGAVAVVDENGAPKMRKVTHGPKKGSETPLMQNVVKYSVAKDVKNGVTGARVGRIK